MTKDLSNIILIDVDDVLWDLLTPWVATINENNNLNTPVTECHDWELEKLFPTLSKEQIYGPMYEENFWKKVQPREGAIEYFRKLVEADYNIRICTATSYKCYKSKTERLMELFPFFDYHNIISCYEKQLINGYILVDDYVGNLKGGVYNKLLFTAQHNLLITDNELNVENITRVKNWEDCYNKILKLCEKTNNQN